MKDVCKIQRAVLLIPQVLNHVIQKGGGGKSWII
jgi:hypothetical protein